MPRWSKRGCREIKACYPAYAASLSKLDRSMGRMENQIGSVLRDADRKIGLMAPSKSSNERNGVRCSSSSAARMARAKPVLASLAPTPLVRWGALSRREMPSMTTTVLGCASSADLSAWIGRSLRTLLSGLLSGTGAGLVLLVSVAADARGILVDCFARWQIRIRTADAGVV